MESNKYAVGQKWKMRNGVVAAVTELIGPGGVMARFTDAEGIARRSTFEANGSYLPGGTGHELDLVELIEEAPSAEQNNIENGQGPKAKAYDAKIKPLLDQIMAIANEEGISFAGISILDGDDEGELRAAALHGKFSMSDMLAFKLLQVDTRQ